MSNQLIKAHLSRPTKTKSKFNYFNTHGTLTANSPRTYKHAVYSPIIRFASAAKINMTLRGGGGINCFITPTNRGKIVPTMQ